jgi:hypothetical protein
MASLVAIERRRLAVIVAAREEELGPSAEGMALLAESKALDEAREKAPPKLVKKRLVRRTRPNERPQKT